VTAPIGFTLRLIDVAQDSRTSYGPDKAAEMFPGLPEHDYRFELVVSRTVVITLNADATAAHVAAYLAREGVAVKPGPITGCPTWAPLESSPTERS
jgi:hypothetical protein